MRKLKLRLCTPSACVAALGLVLSGLCPAQAPNPRSHVTIYTVTPDMLNDWIDLQKNEVVPALKKAGVRSRTIWRNAPFNGSAYEFVSVTPIDNMAQYDGESPLIRALARLRERSTAPGQAAPLPRLQPQFR